MGDSGEQSQKLEESNVVEITGKIMVVAIIVLFMVVIFAVFLNLYAKWYWRSVRQELTNTPRRRRRRDFAAGELSAVNALHRGLDPSVLKSIPVLLFSPKDFADGLECSVCLSEVSEGEKTRLLPKCNHGFHVECIDMWFQSHSTCPLCRNPVADSSSSTPESFAYDTPAAGEVSAAGGVATEVITFPTNVLYWGDETEVRTFASSLEDGRQSFATSSQEDFSSSVSTTTTTSSSSSSSSSGSSNSNSNRNSAPGHLVIDIPREINEEEDEKSPLPLQDEDQKSPLATRLRSLKRLLSRDRKISPLSPSNVDVEQAGRSQS